MKMHTLEGITPDMIWTFLIVLAGLGALIVAGDKVIDVFRRQHQRSLIRQRGPEIAEEISRKVLEKMEPRLNEMDRKLSNDKALIEDHTKKLLLLTNRLNTWEDGQKAQCRGVLALLSHEINGNSIDKLKAAQDGINNYLIER
ncbi:MAG: hypothetical protein IKQ41_11715 [Clostridia bacterium]|nr:hypothetical protein [Clostridia bacterium]